MKELERILIGCCFGEDQYKKVSFLEAEDFTNYPGKPYREYFKLIKKTRSTSNVFLEALVKCEDKELRSLLAEEANVLGVNAPDRYALKLLEIRFQTLFADLLVKLSNSTKNGVERELLNEVIMSLPDVDIFDLSDSLIEYLGLQASDHTKSRINKYLDYRNKRIQTAKKIINELN